MTEPSPAPDSSARVEAVRRFNRFYTRRLGLLNTALHGGPFSLTEARVLYELAARDRPSGSAAPSTAPLTAGDLARDLGLDAGYLSRLLARFRRLGLMSAAPDPQDRRRTLLRLTDAGRDAFAPLDRAASAEVEAMLAPLAPGDRADLLSAMGRIEGVLRQDGGGPITLRPHQPGDMGWIVHRHAALYAQEYGWDISFEALVAEIAAGFLRDFKPGRERAWIACRTGATGEQIVGSLCLVAASDEVAKLRLLLIEPEARGHGLGRRMVAESVNFARRAGYRKMTLWTQDFLLAARRIYADAGFRNVAQEPTHAFGKAMVSETWERDL